MKFPATLALLCLPFAWSGTACADNMLANGSFESGIAPWTTNPSYTIVKSSGWNGVTAQDGSWLLAVSGPASVGYSYADLVTQSLSAPFGDGLPTDNFLVYLYAVTYLHTNDGRNVSYALILEPGYGAMGSTFHGGPQDEWVVAQTSGYYYAKDPFDASSPTKPLEVILQLRDPLFEGEYLLLDNVWLYYGGGGQPEPASVFGLEMGPATRLEETRTRRRP